MSRITAPGRSPEQPSKEVRSLQAKPKKQKGTKKVRESVSSAVPAPSSARQIVAQPVHGTALFDAVIRDLMPTLLPEIVSIAKDLFSVIPGSELDTPELWEAKIPKTGKREKASRHVDTYFGKISSPEKQERKQAALAYMTDYMEKLLPLFFPVFQQSEALIPYFIPSIQAKIVDVLDKKLLPHLPAQHTATD